MDNIVEIKKSILEGDISRIERLIRATLNTNMTAKEILDKSVIAAMRTIGDQFEKGDIFLPELLMSGATGKAAVKILKPLLINQDKTTFSAGKAAIGTIQGDIHDIGKDIVIMMLEANGWDVIDLGVDVSPEEFCIAVKENDLQILGLSALLTGTMPAQERTIEALKTAGLRDNIKVAIGGAPVTQRYADQIGADCYAADAAEAVKKFRLLLQ